VSLFLRSLLVPRNYEVILASQRVARTMLLEGTGSLDLLITNSPREFAAMPDMPLLYLSASPEPEAIQGFARASYLAKPFHPRDLFESIRRLLS
jgi:hypothetical protein